MGHPNFYFDMVYFCCNYFTFTGITLTAKHLEAEFAVVYESLFMTSKKPMFPSINWQILILRAALSCGS